MQCELRFRNIEITINFLQIGSVLMGWPAGPLSGFSFSNSADQTRCFILLGYCHKYFSLPGWYAVNLMYVPDRKVQIIFSDKKLSHIMIRCSSKKHY